MKEIITAASKGVPLGSTADGADWCLKALHPSDPLTQVRGIPDKSAVPSVFMNYQSTYTVTNPDPAKAAPWELTGQLIPHPITFLSVGATDGLHNSTSSFLNTQLDGATHAAKYASWIAMMERWRLAYMSVTIYQDAPALSNQGTIVGAQHVVAPKIVQGIIFNNLTNRYYGFPRVSVLQLKDTPNYNVLQSMPNAYFNRSVEGMYMPLKLTRTCQQWHSTESQNVFMQETISAVPPYELTIPIVASTQVWPFEGADGFHLDASVPSAGGTVTSPFCNDVWGTFAARNLGPTTSFSFFVRAGFEVQVQPGTVLTSHQKLSPQYDRAALDSYFAIAREMKDGYPCEYNDKGRILDTISRIANNVSPFLGMLPGVGSILAPIAKGVGFAASALDSAISPGEKPSGQVRTSSGEYGRTTSMADKERALKAKDIAATKKMIAAQALIQRSPSLKKAKKKTTPKRK